MSDSKLKINTHSEIQKYNDDTILLKIYNKKQKLQTKEKNCGIQAKKYTRKIRSPQNERENLLIQAKNIQQKVEATNESENC